MKFNNDLLLSNELRCGFGEDGEDNNRDDTEWESVANFMLLNILEEAMTEIGKADSCVNIVMEGETCLLL